MDKMAIAIGDNPGYVSRIKYNPQSEVKGMRMIQAMLLLSQTFEPQMDILKSENIHCKFCYRM